MEKIEKLLGKLFKKSFWLPKSMITKIEKEAMKPGWKSESALMRHIINQWFEK